MYIIYIYIITLILCPAFYMRKKDALYEKLQEDHTSLRFGWFTWKEELEKFGCLFDVENVTIRLPDVD